MAYGSGFSFAPSIAIGTNSPIGNDDLELQGSVEDGTVWDEDILVSIFHSTMDPTPMQDCQYYIRLGMQV